MAEKISKSGACYVHPTDHTTYECRDCAFFLPAVSRCAGLRPTDIVRPWGTCNHFGYGRPGTFGSQPLGAWSKEDAGYAENPFRTGYGCHQCRYFNQPLQDCQKVDKTSPGVDPGKIMPGGCCDVWDNGTLTPLSPQSAPARLFMGLNATKTDTNGNTFPTA